LVGAERVPRDCERHAREGVRLGGWAMRLYMFQRAPPDEARLLLQHTHTHTHTRRESSSEEAISLFSAPGS
jgi:hypothetical protein